MKALDARRRRLTLDLPGFVYHDSRDLTGFIDGTANPFLDEAPLVAVVPDVEPGAGGSCAMTMRFVHDLAAFDALAAHDQELVFGRTKADSVELAAGRQAARLPHRPRRGRRRRRRGAGGLPAQRPVGRCGRSRACTSCRSGTTSTASTCSSATCTGWWTTAWSTGCWHFTTPLTGSFWFCPSVEALDAIAPVPTTTTDRGCVSRLRR